MMIRYLPLIACLLLLGCGQRPKNTIPSGEPIPSSTPKLQMDSVSSFRTNEPEFFADVDFDGDDERVVTIPGGGPRGMNAYEVYEKGDTNPREDPPFYYINDWTVFDAAEKTITQNTYLGFIDDKTAQKEELLYSGEKDGSFALTDSTIVLMRLKGENFVDSIRVMYRKQGDKMVLVGKVVVK